MRRCDSNQVLYVRSGQTIGDDALLAECPARDCTVRNITPLLALFVDRQELQCALNKLQSPVMRQQKPDMTRKLSIKRHTTREYEQTLEMVQSYFDGNDSYDTERISVDDCRMMLHLKGMLHPQQFDNLFVQKQFVSVSQLSEYIGASTKPVSPKVERQSFGCNCNVRAIVLSPLEDCSREREIFASCLQDYVGAANVLGMHFSLMDLLWGLSPDEPAEWPCLLETIEILDRVKNSENVKPLWLLCWGQRLDDFRIPLQLTEHQYATLYDSLDDNQRPLLARSYCKQCFSSKYTVNKRTVHDVSTLSSLMNMIKDASLKAGAQSEFHVPVFEQLSSRYALRTECAPLDNVICFYRRLQGGAAGDLTRDSKRAHSLASLAERLIPSETGGYWQYNVDTSTEVRVDIAPSALCQGSGWLRMEAMQTNSNGTVNLYENVLAQNSKTAVCMFLQNLAKKQEAQFQSEGTITRRLLREERCLHPPFGVDGVWDISDIKLMMRYCVCSVSDKESIIADISAPIILVGEPGSGKSCLMSQLGHWLLDREVDLVHRCIYRQCGGAMDMREVFGSILAELGITDTCGWDLDSPAQWITLISQKSRGLFSILLDTPCEVAKYDAFMWLPRVLPDNVRIVVSIYPDKCISFHNRVPKCNIVKIPTLKRDRSIQLLSKWLQGKRGQFHDTSLIENILAETGEPTCLLTLNIAHHVLKNLHSYDDVEKRRLPKEKARRHTIVGTGYGTAGAGMMNAQLDMSPFNQVVSMLHNRLNQHCITMLHILLRSRHGLSYNELCEIFCSHLRRTTSRGARLSGVALERSISSITPYLKIRMTDEGEMLYSVCTALRGPLKDDFSFHCEKMSVLKSLSAYFEQNLQKLNGAPRMRNINDRLRTLSELPYHLAHCGKSSELNALLTDSLFLQDKIGSGRLAETIADFRWVFILILFCNNTFSGSPCVCVTMSVVNFDFYSTWSLSPALRV